MKIFGFSLVTILALVAVAVVVRMYGDNIPLLSSIG